MMFSVFKRTSTHTSTDTSDAPKPGETTLADFVLRDGETATKLFKERAGQGEVRAQFNLAYLYCSGFWARTPGIKDEGLSGLRRLNEAARVGRNEGLKWLRTAAEQGHVGAQYTLAAHLLRSGWKLRFPRLHGEPNKANELKEIQEFHSAIIWYEKAANAGHLRAQRELAGFYSDDSDLENFAPNLAASVHWYRQAANRGDPYAQNALGDLYATGRGVEYDLKEAAQWYHAATQVLPVDRALHKPAEALGYIYATGKGVAQDFSKAAELYDIAAQQYRWMRENECNGKGYEEKIYFGDMVAANTNSWLCRAAEDGWSLGRALIANMSEDAEREASKYQKRWPTRTSLPYRYFGMGIEDHPHTISSLRDAAEIGDKHAQFAWGLQQRKNLQAETIKPIEWVLKAAHQGLAPAARWLGDMYDDGDFRRHDPAHAQVQANTYYRMAAQFGDADAQYEVGRSLAICFPRGQGDSLPLFDCRVTEGAVGENKEAIMKQAADWYSRAASNGHAQAQMQLAALHWLGEGVEKNYLSAVNLLRLSAQQGYANAQYLLAECYRAGFGPIMGLPDHAGATAMYRKAAAQGHKSARNALPYFEFDGDPFLQDGAAILDWLVDRKAE